MQYPALNHSPATTTDPLWWQSGVIYQIYPRSFQDSNADGIGDLAGILSRLDYLHDLGVKCLWLSPVYPSPMYDFGYDISSYTGIDPIFGDLDRFRQLLEAVHQRGMRLIMDWVPNHTSAQHPWFLESRSGLHNPKRDWYIWRDPARDGGPPNNWISFFGGSAWEWDGETAQYYLHQFVREQPELNYRNPAVRAAMLEAMQFWLDMGVDGFRVDVIWLLIKDEALRDEPLNPAWDGNNPHARLLHIHTANQPEVHALIRQFRQHLDQYPETLMLGEIDLPFAELTRYYGSHLDECHLPSNFSLIHVPWQAAAVGRLIADYLAHIPEGGWPNWVLGNHDQRRLASRLGQRQARVACLLLLTLPGTPVWYYGDELGLENGVIPEGQIRDPQAVNQPEQAASLGRDPERTPMQWNTSAHAGFSPAGVEPWLPVSADYLVRNVAIQSGDPGSFLTFFRNLMRLRNDMPVLALGGYQSISSHHEDVLVYMRHWQDVRVLVLLNFGSGVRELDLGATGSEGQWLLNTQVNRTGRVNLSAVRLEADEACLIRIESPRDGDAP